MPRIRTFAARLLGGKAGYKAALQAVMTHGGMGYAKAYNVERYLREVILGRFTPVSEQMVLSFIAEKVLGLPKSYQAPSCASPWKMPAGRS